MDRYEYFHKEKLAVFAAYSSHAIMKVLSGGDRNVITQLRLTSSCLSIGLEKGVTFFLLNRHD
jgi:hypothetical protein